MFDPISNTGVSTRMSTEKKVKQRMMRTERKAEMDKYQQKKREMEKDKS